MRKITVLALFVLIASASKSFAAGSVADSFLESRRETLEEVSIDQPGNDEQEYEAIYTLSATMEPYQEPEEYESAGFSAAQKAPAQKPRIRGLTRILVDCENTRAGCP